MSWPRHPDAPGPSRPAEAAYIMLALLPAWSLLREPPRRGVELVVGGRDNRPTVWRLPMDVAIDVGRHLRTDRRIRHLRAAMYDAQEDV